MARYANCGGDSGVVAYSITPNSITVQFKDGWKYLYDSYKPGQHMVEHMQTLARSGHGLNSYITTTVKSNFASKSR